MADTVENVAENNEHMAVENKENAEFTRIVAWDKLGELCNQLLKKGNTLTIYFSVFMILFFKCFYFFKTYRIRFFP